MGNFESDEGQHLFSFIPRGRITIHVHTPLTPAYSHFLFIKRNERIIKSSLFLKILLTIKRVQ